MKVEKLVKDLFKNHSVLAVVLGAVVLVYFLDNYSKGKGTFGMASSAGSFETPAGFSDQGGSLGDVPNVQNGPGGSAANCCGGGSNYGPAAPLGYNGANATVSGVKTNQHGLPPSCSRQQVTNPKELLPRGGGDGKFSMMNPEGAGNVNDVSLLRAGYHIGINTVSSSLRNANLQLRSEPPNPQLQIGPWNTSTIGPDFNRKPLEIGCGPL